MMKFGIVGGGILKTNYQPFLTTHHQITVVVVASGAFESIFTTKDSITEFYYRKIPFKNKLIWKNLFCVGHGK